MGRKKRKAVELEPANDEELAASMPPKEDAPAAPAAASVVEPDKSSSTTVAPASSSYAVTSHSAEIIGEDIYVSDGSEDEEEDADILLAGSRMGLMRRGLHQPGLLQPNRQWQRETVGENKEINNEEEEEKREQELAKLDPVERAKRLLAEKQRKLEEAKEAARLIESQENAGRDPCLFSKRTAFDIRMDQIEDKPWEGGSDLTDFFNYGFTEQDWVEYSSLQLQIRQELTDASRQRRPPDPNIVPVTPKTPHKQAPRVAVAVRDSDDDDDLAKTGNTGEAPAIGPTLVKQDDNMDVDEEGDDEKKVDVSDSVGGGAWGAGVTPGSHLAKLIEEQERKASAAAPPAFQQQSDQGDSFSDRGGGGDYYGGGGGGGGGSDYYGGGGQESYAPSVPHRGGQFSPSHGGPPPSFRGRGRGFGPPGPNNMPPPWAGRGRRGGFRGGYGGGYRR